jgi:acyl-coenzyme A synthetase/AMP-(fatty) acid ligase
MAKTALLSHTSPTAVVAYRGGQAVTAWQFLGDAARLAGSLPEARHVLNVCKDRYRFTVGLAACLLTRRVSLLPSTQTPQVIAQLKTFAPDAFCLTDDARCNIDLPQLFFPEEPPAADGARTFDAPASDIQASDTHAFDGGAFDARTYDAQAFEVPQIPDAQLAAIVFTSGSTGTPLPYQKTWGRLARCVQSGAPRLGLSDGRAHALVGTVPPQHMYGFESTVLLGLQSGNAFSAERPFYPLDVAAAVAAVPRPRALVTTPIHLRTLLSSEVKFPEVDLIISATAPLAKELAGEVEEKYGAKLLEIYGSTETGQIATRRTTESAAWRLWPGVTLDVVEDRVYARGGHIEQVTPMCDLIEITDGQEFLLHGRTADMVNVAGKRSSFGYLDAQLNSIPGVVDGAFFLRSGLTGSTGVVRLGALAVAPALSVAALLEALKQRIDSVFLPRPLILVERLPRNATGKLPQHALERVVDDQLRPEPRPAQP